MNVSSIGYSDYAARTPAATATVSAGQQVAAQRQLVQATRVVNQSGILGRNQIVFSIDGQTRQRVVLIEDKETHDNSAADSARICFGAGAKSRPLLEKKPKGNRYVD